MEIQRGAQNVHRVAGALPHSLLWLFADKCTAKEDPGAGARAWGQPTVQTGDMVNGSVRYNSVGATEDRARVGTDVSAVGGRYGTGGILRGAACPPQAGLVCFCRRPKAANPERPACRRLGAGRSESRPLDYFSVLVEAA